MGLYLVGNSDRESGFGMGGGTKIGRPVETHTRTQIMKIVEQMMAEGASEQEIEEFLKQIGMTLEELEMAEEMFGMGEGALGFTI
jgi:hypothetical protein